MANAQRRSPNIWPGFVDAIASLLIVVVFALLLATVGYFFLTNTLTGKESALQQLTRQFNALSDVLSMEKTRSKRLAATLATTRASLEQSRQHGKTLETDLADNREQLQTARSTVAGQRHTLDTQASMLAQLQQDVTALQALKAQLQQQIAQTLDAQQRTENKLDQQTRLAIDAKAQVALLNRQLAEFRHQVAALNQTLAARDEALGKAQSSVKDLGRRLNLALADEVNRLKSYRSEFFGQLRKVLADRPDVRIVGDRFILPSELLFASGSDQLGAQGVAEVAKLAVTLHQIAAKIPSSIDWILRIDGHTDRRPIQNSKFASNWELSSARALRLVKALIARGIPPQRLAATGFAEYHPIAMGNDEHALAQNRRIEIKLTSR